jgi:DnaK suppressor protein
MRVTSIDAGLKRREAALRSKLAELLKLSEDRGELEIQALADPLDQVRLSTDRDMAVEALNQHARSIREIRAAIDRIGEGSYGECERCEESIPPKRLEALPWARLCVKCQSAVEAESRGGVETFRSAA